MTVCYKCGSRGTVTLRKKDIYCNGCFLNNINHKFRACIGKNKILSKNENVLVCVSEGLASAVLLDLIHYALSLDNHKKLYITPFFFHVTGLASKKEELANTNITIENCKKYNFNVHIGHISEYGQKLNYNERQSNYIPQIDSLSQAQLENLMASMTVTTRKDFLEKVKRELYIQCAKNFNCQYIFTGETTSTLAVNLLTNLSLGRGSQVEHDIGFCDSRNEVKILRPMKDISQEELHFYKRVKHLSVFQKAGELQETSLQSVIKTFITDLQDNFQSTISTVCKTADKIGTQEEVNNCLKCKFCESDIDEKCNKLTALQATNFSRSVSVGQANSSLESFSMFPYINKYFCYSCSKNFMEINMTNIPDAKRHPNLQNL